MAGVGCTSSGTYESGQAWQRNECNKIIDVSEMRRFIDKANKPYGEYRRKVDKATSIR